MNDLMSLGTHRLMKRFTIELSGLRKGHKVLDLAGGTGDFSLRFSPLVGPEGQVVLADINEAMLAVGREIASTLVGEHSTLLAPFSYERFSTGELHPVSNSPYPWS